MKIPAKNEYALKALLELSLHWPNQEPLAMHDISKRQSIPLKYLTQILLTLKSLDLVESIRGNQGGYLLKKNPSQINFADILGSTIRPGVSKKDQSGISVVLREVDEALIKHLTGITFEQLVRRERDTSKAPMYTI